MRPILVFSLVAGALGIGSLVARTLRTEMNSAVPTIKVELEAFTRSVPAEGYLKAETATPITAPVGVPSALKVAWVKENGASVAAGEVVMRFDEDDFKRNLADGNSDKNAANAKLSSEQLQNRNAAESRARAAELAQKNLALSQSRAEEQDDEIFSANEILTTRIDGKLSEARVQHSKAAGRIDRSIASTKIQLLELERQAAQLAIARAEQGLQKMEVTAPHAGIFVYDDPNLKAGDSIYPGRAFAKLPLIEKMQAEVFVLEADAMGLEVGKSASLFVESQQHTIYNATIMSVDTLAKPRQEDVPIQYFSVVLELEKTDPAVMKPGQRVQANLKLESLDALVVPRHCIFENDGDLLAYRLKAGTFEAVKVKLGPGTPGRVVVEEGLSAGDRIATRDPFGDVSSDEDSAGGDDTGSKEVAAP